MFNPNAASIARQNELISDLWIEQNVVGGLNSKLNNDFVSF
jgi:hypothetical protein